MRPLPFRIGMGNQGAGFAQPKAPLPEQPLTLAHRQMNPEAPLDPGTQRFPIPQRAGRTKIARSLAQRPVQFLQLRIAQSSGAAGALSLAQPGQPSLLETSDPIFHRARSIAQQPADLRTGHALGHQQRLSCPSSSSLAVKPSPLAKAPSEVRYGWNDEQSLGRMP